jgi:hypothetical protein
MFAAIGTALLVRVMQRDRGGADDRDDVLERQPLLVLREVREQAAQILAVHVLHREEVLVAFLPDVVDLNDVGVVQLRGEARLVQEHLHERLILRLTRTNPFDHDVARETFDAGRAGEQDFRHATARQMLDDLVAAELGARCGGWPSHARSSVTPGRQLRQALLVEVQCRCRVENRCEFRCCDRQANAWPGPSSRHQRAQVTAGGVREGLRDAKGTRWYQVHVASENTKTPAIARVCY